MGAEERLTFDAVSAHTISATEHRHRYEWAADLCRGCRVLDLACGVGYGSSILATQAKSVTGIDVSAATIEAARSHFAADNVSFEVSDAHAVLRRDLEQSFDALVCFEGLEHLPQLELALEQLERLADAGLRLVLSVPNSRGFDEENEFHLTDFGYEEMREAFARFPNATHHYQWIAEGSLIAGPEEVEEWPARVVFTDRTELEYANNFLLAVNVPEDELVRAAEAHMHLQIAPYYNRELRVLQNANEELWRANADLGRRLRRLARRLDALPEDERPESVGKGDTAAAMKLAKTAHLGDEDVQKIIRERDEIAEAMRWQERRAEEAEAYAERLERELAALRRTPPKRGLFR